MGIVSQSKFSPVSRREYQTGRAAQAVDWKELFKANHYLWEHSGARAESYVFDPKFTRPDANADGTYSRVNFTNDTDLSEFEPAVSMHRDAGSSRGLIVLGLEVYGRHYDVRITVEREDPSGSTQIDQSTLVTTSGTKEWSLQTTDLTFADTRASGSSSNDAQILSLRVEARSNSNTEPAEIYQLDMREAIFVPTTDFPDTL